MRAKREGVSSLLASSLLALPTGYTQLDKLEFNGSQWIETGYCPAASDRFECEVTVADDQPRSTAAVFGTVREGELERTFAFYVRQGGDDSTVVAYGDMARGGFFPRGKEVSLSVGPDGATWTWDGGSDRLSLTPGFAQDGVTPLLIGEGRRTRILFQEPFRTRFCRAALLIYSRANLMNEVDSTAHPAHRIALRASRAENLSVGVVRDERSPLERLPFFWGRRLAIGGRIVI